MNEKIVERAIALGSKILPKTLASEVPILVTAAAKVATNTSTKVDLVLVDDNKTIITSTMLFLEGANVDFYYNPFDFLNAVRKYTKDTPMIIDYDFKLGDMNGLEVCWRLHQMGYTRLYLFTGVMLKKENLPTYLEVIEKQDINAIHNLVFKSVAAD
jgi:CheY-like chemotaxis protein